MYTSEVRRKQKRPTHELGMLLFDWRESNNLTVAAAGGRVGVAKSTWSKWENGDMSPSVEALVSISAETGVPLDELATRSGHEIKISTSSEDRAHRIAAVAEAIPQVAIMVDLLTELEPHEVDTLVSVAETMIRRRKQG